MRGPDSRGVKEVGGLLCTGQGPEYDGTGEDMLVGSRWIVGLF